MTLEEAVQFFDLVDDLVDTTDAIGIPTCCDLPVVQNSTDGFNRISCLECGREIRQVGRQWVVSDWGRKGINLLKLNGALTVEASRAMAQTTVPDNLEMVASGSGAGGDERRRFDEIGRFGMPLDGIQRYVYAQACRGSLYIGDSLPGESNVDSTPTWGDLLALLRTQRELEGEVERLRAALESSVRLQSHYAKLLNMHDGGERIGFESAQQWLERLDELERKP